MPKKTKIYLNFCVLKFFENHFNHFPTTSNAFFFPTRNSAQKVSHRFLKHLIKQREEAETFLAFLLKQRKKKENFNSRKAEKVFHAIFSFWWCSESRSEISRSCRGKSRLFFWLIHDSLPQGSLESRNQWNLLTLSLSLSPPLVSLLLNRSRRQNMA